MGSTILTWKLMADGLECSPPSTGNWNDVVGASTVRDEGVLQASRLGAYAKLLLRLNRDFAFLEYWADIDQPLLAAQFANQRAISETDVEMPCWGWAGRDHGPPLAVPGRFVIRRVDGVSLFLQYLRSGSLPAVLGEPPRVNIQLPLPGMERFVTPWIVVNAVEWKAPWPKVTPRYVLGG
jgi:hypothetical protein